MKDYTKLNQKLKEHQNATLGTYDYNFDDPYEEAKRQMRLVNSRKVKKLDRRDKKLKRQKRLLPPPKV